VTRSFGFLLDDNSGGGTFSGGSFLAGLFTDNGQLIIGASTNGFTVTTLTAGSGIGITNGPGSIEIYASGGGSSGAPIDASYVVMSANTSLSADRVLTGTTHQITVTDTGANGAAILALGFTGVSPVFFNGTSGQIGVSLGATLPLYYTNGIFGLTGSLASSLISFGFTPGSVLYAGLSGQITQQNNSFFYDDTNLTLRVGGNATLPFNIIGLTIIPQFDVSNDSTGGADRPAVMTLRANGIQTNIFAFLRNNGSATLPTSVTDGDQIGAFYGFAYGASNFRLSSSLQYYIDGTVSSTLTPTSIRFLNSRQSGNPLRPAFTFGSDDYAKIGDGLIVNDLGSTLPFYVKSVGSSTAPLVMYAKTSGTSFGPYVSFFGESTLVGSKLVAHYRNTPTVSSENGFGSVAFFGGTFTQEVEFSNYLSVAYFASLLGGFTGFVAGFRSFLYPPENGVTLQSLYGYLSDISKTGDAGTTGTLSSVYGVNVRGLPGSANILEAVAYGVDSQFSKTYGTSFTYTLKAQNDAPSILGGSLTVGSSANPQYTLDVYGSARVSSSMLISSITTSAILYSGTTGLVKQDSGFFSYDDSAKKLFAQNVNIMGLTANRIIAAGSSLDLQSISVAAPLYFSNSVLGFSSSLGSTLGVWGALSATNSIWYSGTSGIIGSSLGVTFPLFFTNNVLGFTFQIFGFTVGAVLFAGSSGTIITDKANFWYDDTDNQLMLNSYGVSAFITSSINIKSSSTRAPITIRSYGAFESPGIFFSHASGTEAGPSLVASGGIVHSLAGFAYNGIDYNLITNIRSEVDGTPGASTMSGRLSFNTKTADLSNTSEVMRITGDGKVGIQTSTPEATLQVNGPVIVKENISDGSSFVLFFSDLTVQNNTFTEETSNISNIFKSSLSSAQTGGTVTISNVGVYNFTDFSTGLGEQYGSLIGYAAQVENLVSGASCSNAAAFYVVQPTNAGLVGNYFGLLVPALNSNVVNSYGVYIENQSTQYAIFSLGGKSIHQGNIAIGSTLDPQYTLDVVGSAKVSSSMLISSITNSAIIYSGQSGLIKEDAAFFSYDDSAKKLFAQNANIRGLSSNQIVASGVSLDLINISVATPLYFSNSILGFSSALSSTTGIWRALSATGTVWYSGNSGIIGSSLGFTGPLFFTNNVVGYSSAVGSTIFSWGANSATGIIWYSGTSGIIGSSLGFAAPLFLSSNILGLTQTGITHGFLSGLTLSDDHTQYALLGGRGGEQILYGATINAGQLVLRSTRGLTKGVVLFDEETDSTSFISGAVRMNGGLGVVKNVNIGGGVNIGGVIQAAGATSGGVYSYFGGRVFMTDTVEASSASLAALSIYGGLSVSKNVQIYGTTPAISVTTASVVLAGGLGVNGTVWAGTRIYSDGPSGTNRGMQMNTDGVARWAFLAGSTAEGGSDTGSPFVINALSDAGAYIDSVMFVLRPAGGTFLINRPLHLTGSARVGTSLSVVGPATFAQDSRGTKQTFFGGFNIPANTATDQYLLDPYGITMSSTWGYSVGKTGSIADISFIAECATYNTTGNLSIEVRKNGTLVAGTTVSVTGTGVFKGFGSTLRGNITFVPNDVISLYSNFLSGSFLIKNINAYTSVYFDT